MKEKHTFVFSSTIGPIQIGIPPETIKTSMKKGGTIVIISLFCNQTIINSHNIISEDVPTIYVLPPVLFAEDLNFGEVEFPMYPFSNISRHMFFTSLTRIALLQLFPFLLYH